MSRTETLVVRWLIMWQQGPPIALSCEDVFGSNRLRVDWKQLLRWCWKAQSLISGEIDGHAKHSSWSRTVTRMHDASLETHKDPTPVQLKIVVDSCTCACSTKKLWGERCEWVGPAQLIGLSPQCDNWQLNSIAASVNPLIDYRSDPYKITTAQSISISQNIYRSK
jgi:hypothetical protein